MIEIVSGESACGSLKMAQRYGVGAYCGGSMGVQTHHSDGREFTLEELETLQKTLQEQAKQQWESGTPLGGSSSDVFGFHGSLSMGDISESPL